LGAQLPDAIERIQAALMRDGRWEGEVQHRRKDGTPVWVAAQWVVHYDDQGKVRAVLEVNADITARKRADAALRASEAFNRSILESSPDCLCVLDAEGRIKFVSPEGLKLMEADSVEALGQTFWPDFWEGEFRSAAEEAYRRAL